MELHSRIFRLIFLVICTGLIGVSGYAQQTIHVPAGEPTIQAGIDAASNGDTVLVAPGVYQENIDFNGKAITVTSGATSFSGAAQTIIEGLTGPTVTYQSGEPSSAVLNGFTIEHVPSGGSGSSPALGEGIFISGASPTITNNVIANNLGCGVAALQSSSPLIQGNDIRQNTYISSVTGVSCGNSVELPPGTGVGILNAINVQALDNTIEGNNSDDCGGGIIALDTQNLLIENNIIRNNQAACSAGAFLRSISNLSLIQNLVYGNVAQPTANYGGGTGGIFITVDSLANPLGGAETILNNTVYGNRTLSLGGAEAPSIGEELYIEYQPSQSYIENNIFDNTDASQAVYCDFLGGYNYQYNDTLNAVAYIPQNCGNGQGNISADPLFLNPANGDFHLPANSPAVATGNVSVPDLPSTDLDGLSRTYDGRVDMGVYEYHPPTSDTTALISSANPSYVGQLVTFTATVTPLHPNGTLTGTVAFNDGATNLGTVNISPAGVAALSIASLSVGTHPITAIYSGDTTQQPSTSNTVNQVVTLIGTSTTLSSSQNPAVFGQKVTFTATVQSALPDDIVPGSVDFYGGSTLLSSATLDSGTTTYSISTLATGSHTMTAKFPGNSTYAASSSAVLSEIITSDFGITVTPSSRSVYTGQSTTATVALTPNGGFDLLVALFCSGLPANSSCNFSPGSISGNGSSKLTIQTAAPHQISALSHDTPSFPWRGWGTLALSGCVFFLIPRRSRRRGGSRIVILILGLSILSLGTVSGCGAPGPVTGGTPPGTYTITVTGTSTVGGGSISHSAALTLKVESYF